MIVSKTPGGVQAILAMQAQTNVFPVQTQVVGQTRVVPVQTVTTTQQGNAPRRAGMEVFEVIFRVICTVSYIYKSC